MRQSKRTPWEVATLCGARQINFSTLASRGITVPHRRVRTKRKTVTSALGQPCEAGRYILVSLADTCVRSELRSGRSRGREAPRKLEPEGPTRTADPRIHNP